MQLIQLSRSQDSLYLSFLCFFDICILLVCVSVCNTLQHNRYGRAFRLTGALYANGCSRLRRRRCLQGITGPSLATSCGPLVLQERVKQNVSHVTTVRAVRHIVWGNLLLHSYINRCTVVLNTSGAFFLLNPCLSSRNLQTNVLATYGFINWAVKQTQCLPFHFWFWGGCSVSYELYWNRQCCYDCEIWQLQVKT